MTATHPTNVPDLNARRVNVGDVFCCSWGYNQTNVDYYVAVAVSKTGRVKLHACGKWQTEDRGSGYTKVAPDPARLIGEPTGYKVPHFYESSRWDAERGESVPELSCWVRMNSYSTARRVDPMSDAYETAAGWGH